MMNLLVVRQTGDTNRDSTFALFKQVINKWNLSDHFKVNESDLRIRCKLNGNEIIFKGLDDTEKLKSITFSRGELTDVWIEEASEVEEQSFNQLDVRLRGGKEQKQITLSFNPVNINHWLKRFVDAKQSNKMCLHTTYKQNKFLDDEYKKLLESYKDKDPYYYQVYCLGEWGVVGKTIFNAQIVSERLAYIRMIKPLKKGFFIYKYENEKIISFEWIDDFETGYIVIYEDVKRGYPYVIGGDTSGEGSDWFVGQVINNVTGIQESKLRHQFDEDLYAKQMFCLGKYYNYALLGIETNFSTYPVKELVRLGYTNQYTRQQEDTFTGKTEKAYGFKTTSLTRPLIIAELVTIVREHTELFSDIDTLEEMLTFVRNEKGRPEAQQGSHDDCIMAMAISYYVRTQQSYQVVKEEEQLRETLLDKLGIKKDRITIKEW
jgi:phage terminase large subunit